MNLADAVKLPPGLEGRFSIVNFLPTAAGVVGVLVLAWARIGDRLSFKQAWKTAQGLTASQIILLIAAVLFIAVVLQPFQLALVRVLEGIWPRWLGPVERALSAWHRRRRCTLERETVIPLAEAGDEQRVRTAGIADLELRTRYSLASNGIRPTRLGNCLAAMEYRSGRDYGIDAVVAWPRLYPLLGPATKALVDDRRNSVDISARLAVTMFVAGLVALVPLWGTGAWMLLAVAFLGVSRLAYLACVQAAAGYGETVQAAFDLHRFALLEASRLPLPRDRAEELIINRHLSDLWRQGAPLPADLRYAHPEEKRP
ncbi:hypothetical protein [Actinoplanes sp. HUAS TT8]|uniref:hypothetical protein n=1 Tax=Actinoplanes sp. HUAS TT8 TaxID=3447453 RepID=UPI003F526DA4